MISRLRLRHLLWLMAFIGFCQAALVGPALAGDDLKTTLSIRNDGTEPLKCVIIFGHWVTTDIAAIQPNQTSDVTIMRAIKDGALYVPRFDGRHMMVERIACGRVDSWWESIGDVPLLPLRETPQPATQTQCRLDQHAECTVPRAAS